MSRFANYIMFWPGHCEIKSPVVYSQRFKIPMYRTDSYPSTQTGVYFHGAGSDLHQVKDMIDQWAQLLQMTFYCFEYPGYYDGSVRASEEAWKQYAQQIVLELND